MEIRPCTITLCDHHHTAGHEANTQAVRQEHLNIGWGDIGYNMVIEADGNIVMGRDTKYSGSHDPGKAPDGSGYTMNQRSFSISCIGNFDNDGEFMTEQQYQGLLKGSLWVDNKYGLGASQHRRHRDQYATDCPGKNFPWARLIADIQASHNGTTLIKAPAATPPPVVVAPSSFTYPNNAKCVGSNLPIYDSNGNAQPGRYVETGDNITVLDVSYSKQLILVQYPTTSGVTRSGYVKVVPGSLQYYHQGLWKNGSTVEPVLAENGSALGSLGPRESATPLYRKNGKLHVVYNTTKGANTKSGYVAWNDGFTKF